MKPCRPEPSDPALYARVQASVKRGVKRWPSAYASALVFDPDNPGDSTVAVGAITSGHLQVLGERALRSSLAATNDGLARGAKILFDAVEQEMDLRQPKILM